MLPIRVHLTPAGPNSWKVILLLEELLLPYEVIAFQFPEVKKEPFIGINPNGRVPAIEDPNTDLTLWESGAILHYLVNNYDSTGVLTNDTLVEKNLDLQWLMFQVSGQGPYWGQASWFHHLHPEKLPSAIERYDKEVRRVLGVLDKSLNGKQWLVGSKMTYADLAFLPFNNSISAMVESDPDTLFSGFNNIRAWHERLAARPSWAKCMELRAKIMDEQGLLPNGLPKSGTVANHAKYVAQGESQTNVA